MSMSGATGNPMSDPFVLTPNESRVIQLLRNLKENQGHGTIRIEITAGMESLFKAEKSELPPERAMKS